MIKYVRAVSVRGCVVLIWVVLHFSPYNNYCCNILKVTKNILQNVSQCRDGKPWKMAQTRMGWHTLHTHWQTRIGWHTLHTHIRDGNVCEVYVILFLFASVCEVYVIPFLFGSFFTVCHPYIDLHFVKCLLCYLFLPFLGGSNFFWFIMVWAVVVWFGRVVKYVESVSVTNQEIRACSTSKGRL